MRSAGDDVVLIGMLMYSSLCWMVSLDGLKESRLTIRGDEDTNHGFC